MDDEVYDVEFDKIWLNDIMMCLSVLKLKSSLSWSSSHCQLLLYM
jgi:hypothetical protein